MVRGRGTPRRRIHRIGRFAIILFCALLILSGYLYRAELLAMFKPDPGAEEQEPDPPEELPEPVEKPVVQPEPEGEQLDAPDPEPVPEPPSPKKDSFVPVDGDDYFALVTKETTLGRYAPTDLEQIPAEIVHPDRRGGKYYLRREPLQHLKQMWQAAQENDGVQLTVTSAYRSYDTQVSTFNYWVKKDGEAKAVTYSARAGQSEHQLGTTLDFNIDISAGAAQHVWLAEHAHEYGFALSYPRGAQEITGYKFEPWHYRYIGVEAAGEWKESGLPLCKYLEQKR
ncbi:MAG: M15 family metallopeptidase [Firmicutes bacterium]|nr:M15 family metallopeptidase [Bacillota bacterium]